MVHAIFFDGTSYFVDDFNSNVDDETKIIFRSSNFDLCVDKCDALNDEL